MMLTQETLLQFRQRVRCIEQQIHRLQGSLLAVLRALASQRSFVVCRALLIGVLAYQSTLPTGWAQSSSWDGCYVGLQVGNAWSDSLQHGVHRATGTVVSQVTYSGEQGVWGIYGGSNRCTGRYLFGWEADATTGGREHVELPLVQDRIASEARINASLVGRGGWFVHQDLLVYGLFGVTAGIDSLQSRIGGTSFEQDCYQWGTVVGGGIERRLGVGALRVDLRYYNYLQNNYESGHFPGIDYSDENELLQLRIGYSIPLSKLRFW